MKDKEQNVLANLVLQLTEKRRTLIMRWKCKQECKVVLHASQKQLKFPPDSDNSQTSNSLEHLKLQSKKAYKCVQFIF